MHTNPFTADDRKVLSVLEQDLVKSSLIIGGRYCIHAARCH